MKYQAVLIIHNIRSVYNVGALFRTAEAVGISKIYISGFSPAPLDRFGRVREDLSKSALGAEKMVDWEQPKNISSVLKKLKEQGFTIVAIEQSKNSVDYKKVKLKQKVAFVIGNEVDGVSSEILKKCDVVAEIPMSGKKESLNVSVAFGVAVFRMLNI